MLKIIPPAIIPCIVTFKNFFIQESVYKNVLHRKNNFRILKACVTSCELIGVLIRMEFNAV